MYVPRRESIVERRFVDRNDVGQGFVTRLSIESQSAPKLLILPGKCSVAIKVFQFPKLLM